MPFNIGSYDFVTADKLEKNGWPFFWSRVLEFGPCLALFSTRFGPLAKNRSGNPARNGTTDRVVLKHRGYRDVGVSASAVSANVT